MYCEHIDNETKQVFGLSSRQYDNYIYVGETETAYNGMIYIKGYAPEKPVDVKAAEIRAERDRRIDAMRWRIERYQTQLAAGLPTTDTAEQYQAVLMYVQALRDIPEQAGFPDVIVPIFDEWKASLEVSKKESGGDNNKNG